MGKKVICGVFGIASGISIFMTYHYKKRICELKQQLSSSNELFEKAIAELWDAHDKMLKMKEAYEKLAIEVGKLKSEDIID